MPGAELSRKRIRYRTQAMFREGWLKETKNLVGKGLLTTPTASQNDPHPLYVPTSGSLLDAVPQYCHQLED